MQTNLRGRDVIDFQEWTKDELDTVLDVAFTLKRDRPWDSLIPTCVTRCSPCCSSSPAPGRGLRSRRAWPSSAVTPSSSRAAPPK